MNKALILATMLSMLASPVLAARVTDKAVGTARKVAHGTFHWLVYRPLGVVVMGAVMVSGVAYGMITDADEALEAKSKEEIPVLVVPNI